LAAAGSHGYWEEKPEVSLARGQGFRHASTMSDELEVFEESLGLEGVPEEVGRGGLTDFLYPTPAPRNPWGIVKWWESRRLKYNLIVGASGFVSLGIFSLLMLLPPSPHNLIWGWAPIIAFGTLANICYFLGPLAETAIEKLSRGKILPTGPALFRMGLTFSVGLTLLPTLMAGMDWVIRIIRWII